MLAFGTPFKPGMYFLLGFYSEFSFEARDRSRMFLVLVAHATVSIVFALAALMLPLKPAFRQTIAIALLSPMTSQCVQVVAEVRWGDHFLRVTVASMLASA